MKALIIGGSIIAVVGILIGAWAIYSKEPDFEGYFFI